MNFPNNLSLKLSERKEKEEYRKLALYDSTGFDFFSNDYLGLSKKVEFNDVNSSLYIKRNGATGSRLISGNSELYNQIEMYLSDFYQTETALLFASGYLANVGLLSTLPQKEDTILFDNYCHASIRDGIRLSRANSIAFLHNDYNDLEQKLQATTGICYVVVESLYSMDGNFSQLTILNDLCSKYNAYLIVDEAHSTGIYGEYGEGIAANKNLNRMIARVHTFGKAAGSHGAVICGGKELNEYLVNYCRPFIYTTGLPDFSLLHIKKAHEMMRNASLERKNLALITHYFRAKTIGKSNLIFLDSSSPIQALLGKKSYLKETESILLTNSILVKAIYSPSVERNKERIRICLHSFNTREEIDRLFDFLK